MTTNNELIDSLLEDLDDLARDSRGVEGYEDAYQRLHHLIAGLKTLQLESHQEAINRGCYAVVNPEDLGLLIRAAVEVGSYDFRC
ncbi:hypothetical protein AAY80_246 [Stenotrophomonas phage vB_SmaS-DLP_6]|nr:hypothetical protein AAY80_246 [Stenotrophomonas phage vB_SmaS-DLP_6]